MRKYLEAIVVFLAAVSLDTVWVLWLTSINAHQAMRASIYSMALGALSLVGVSALIKNKYLVVLWIVGLGVGTAVAMRL